jgi:hypothetical protein
MLTFEFVGDTAEPSVRLHLIEIRFFVIANTLGVVLAAKPTSQDAGISIQAPHRISFNFDSAPSTSPGLAGRQSGHRRQWSCSSRDE